MSHKIKYLVDLTKYFFVRITFPFLQAVYCVEIQCDQKIREINVLTVKKVLFNFFPITFQLISQIFLQNIS